MNTSNSAKYHAIHQPVGLRQKVLNASPGWDLMSSFRLRQVDSTSVNISAGRRAIFLHEGPRSGSSSGRLRHLFRSYMLTIDVEMPKIDMQ